MTVPARMLKTRHRVQGIGNNQEETTGGEEAIGVDSETDIR